MFLLWRYKTAWANSRKMGLASASASLDATLSLIKSRIDMFYMSSVTILICVEA